MSLSNLYKSTRTRVATSLAALTLAGGIAVASPVLGQDYLSGEPINAEGTEVFIGPIEEYQFQGNEDFRARYGEEAFQDLQAIQGKYAKAMQAEGTKLNQAAQMKALNYIGLENILKAQAFATEVQGEFSEFLSQYSTEIEGITRDVQAALEGSTEGLEANIEKYMPVIEEGIAFVRDNATEYYQENQEFVDRVVADAKSTFSSPELAAAAEQYQTGMKETLTTQFMDFYERNKPLVDKILGDAQATVTDPEFLGELDMHSDAMRRAFLKEVMGDEFAAQVDSVEVRIERLAIQQDADIQELINELEAKRALEKGF